MTDRLKTIAVVPAPEYVADLLGDGSPLVAYESDGLFGYTPSRAPILWGRKRALPLLIEGKPVPDGIARAVRHTDLDNDHQAASLLWADSEISPGIMEKIGIPLVKHRLLWLAERMRAQGIAAEVIVEPYPEDGGDDE